MFIVCIHFFIICQKWNENLNCCTFRGRKYVIMLTLSSPKLRLRTKSNFFHVWLLHFCRKFYSQSSGCQKHFWLFPPLPPPLPPRLIRVKRTKFFCIFLMKASLFMKGLFHKYLFQENYIYSNEQGDIVYQMI